MDISAKLQPTNIIKQGKGTKLIQECVRVMFRLPLSTITIFFTLESSSFTTATVPQS